MVITVSLSGEKLAHMTNNQYGAFVAHCFGLHNFHSIKCYKTMIEVNFALSNTAALVDSAKIQSQLQEMAEAFASMEPFPCPCGCGAFISVSPCHRQSGELDDRNPANPILNDHEKRLVETRQVIAAIKAMRARYGTKIHPESGQEYSVLGLKDAKEACDKYRDTLLDALPDASPF